MDKKFGIHTADDDGTWLNLYARYNPFADTLRMECEIDSDSPENNQYFDYESTAAEAQLIKEMITEKIQEAYGQTPQEFCQDAWGESFSMGGHCDVGGAAVFAACGGNPLLCLSEHPHG